MNNKAGEPEELKIDAADSDFKLERPGGMHYWPEGGIAFCVYRVANFWLLLSWTQGDDT